jgi:CBS domain-containing protein
MTTSIRVNLHCHSVFSDGELDPEALAERLASAGVVYASLTDHDAIDGLNRFHAALTRRNIGFLSGVEISTLFHDREIHILAYGFDMQHKELRATLQVLRHNRNSKLQGPLRRMPSQLQAPKLEARPAPGVEESGKIDVQEAIALVHRAGGRAFLAHPQSYEPDLNELRPLVVQLQALGLDGIEVTGAHGEVPGQEHLLKLARDLGLLICVGTDFHGYEAESAGLGADMAVEDWKQLVRALGAVAGPAASFREEEAAEGEFESGGTRSRWSSYPPRIVLPSLLAIVLFIVAIWGMLLPTIENTLLDRKRDMIRELANTALSLLGEAAREESEGRLTREEAQRKAKEYIGALRYGKEGKDYFWIQDMHPNMLMHPYRLDLNGKDVSGFTDPRGVKIFAQFAQIVRLHEQGFVEYVWQWKDDPERLAAKESYVTGFKPWGWVIGTGMYIDDVTLEIERIEQNIVFILVGIVLLVFIVLLSNVRQGLSVERKRRDMQLSLQQAEQRYRSLIEATTEGTLLVLKGRCRYANPTMLQLTGYSAERLELLELADLLPREPVNEEVWTHIESLQEGAGGGKSFEAVLERADGEKKECIATLNPMPLSGHPGVIVLIKDISPSLLEASSVVKLGQAAQAAAIGIFQARATRRGVIVAVNGAALALLRSVCSTQDQFALEDLFDDIDEFNEFTKSLRRAKAPLDRMIQKPGNDGIMRTLSLSSVLIEGQRDPHATINCVISDVTDTVRSEHEREALIDKLRISLLFLQEPVGQLGGPAVSCNPETPVHEAASLMAQRDTTSIVVEDDEGVGVGFLTDRDFRKRLAGMREADLQIPVRTIMSAPLVTISGNAMIYEALMLMEEKKVQHLVVQDGGGRITSVVRAKDLLQFHRYGPEVLPREISRAATVEQVVLCCRRLPALVKALIEAGARPRTVAYMTTAVCDAATARFIQLAVEELGPPPASFAFIAMGSQGRQEQTLLTDQDNAIIYLPDDAHNEALSDYFLSMGQRVCLWLSQAGYALCDGQVMASNPEWCRSLPEWKDKFAEWILKAEPKELLDISISLDFRPVYGDAELANELRTFIHKALKDRPSFLPHLAQNALLFKPPFRLLGRIITSSGSQHEAGRLNTKETLMPIIGFGRLYALRHKLPYTHSMERIEALVWKKVLQPSACDAVSESYDFLMRLRFQAQLTALDAGRPMDNTILLNKMGNMDEAMLKQAFLQIESLQRKIGYDFLGGAEWPGH